MVDNVAFAPTFTTGTSYWFKIKFTPGETTVEMHTGARPNGSAGSERPLRPRHKFQVTTVEQNAYYDNIVLDEVY